MREVAGQRVARVDDGDVRSVALGDPVVGDAVLTAGGEGTDLVVLQTNPGVTNGVQAAVGVSLETEFGLGDGAQAVAQRFRGAEADTRTRHFARFDTAELVVFRLVVLVADVDHAVNGHVRLREGSARHQTGDSQCDEFLLHCESPLGLRSAALGAAKLDLSLMRS